MNFKRNLELLLLPFICAIFYTNVAIAQSAEKINSVTFSGMSLYKTAKNKWAVADSATNKPFQYITETKRDDSTIHLWVEETKSDVRINSSTKTITIPSYDSSGVKNLELKLSGWSEQMVTNGWTVNEVKTGYGSFYKEVDNKWVETDLKGAATGSFTETNRDNWSVYLLKNDGNELRIDLFLKTTFFTTKGEKPFELYKLTDWANEIKTSGFTVNSVKAGIQTLFKVKDTTWISMDTAGKLVDVFFAQRRDDSSVLLSGANTAKLFIDVKNKKLIYSQPDLTEKPIVFSLTDWSNDIPENGFTVNQVSAGKIVFSTMPGLGKWVYDRNANAWKWVDKFWIETDSTKKPFANFYEISRSANSIVLKKDDGLVLRISLTDRMIYSQIDTNKEKVQFIINSISKAEIINGWTVKSVTFSNGAFSQKEDKKWVELNADNKETGFFTEVNRDEGSVYLLKDEGSELRIDLYLKSTFFTPKGEKPFELYKLTGWRNY
jgi:hypothetical protein